MPPRNKKKSALERKPATSVPAPVGRTLRNPRKPKSPEKKSPISSLEKDSTASTSSEAHNPPISSIDFKKLLINDCSVVLNKVEFKEAMVKDVPKSLTPSSGRMGMKTRSKRINKSRVKDEGPLDQKLNQIDKSIASSRIRRNEVIKSHRNLRPRLGKEDNNKDNVINSEEDQALSVKRTTRTTLKNHTKSKSKLVEKSINSKEQSEVEEAKKKGKAKLTKRQLTLLESIELKEEEKKKKISDIEEEPEENSFMSQRERSEPSQHNSSTTSDSGLRFEPKSFYAHDAGSTPKPAIKKFLAEPLLPSDVYTFQTPTSPKKAKKTRRKVKAKVLTSVENQAGASSPDATKRFFMTKRSKLTEKKEVVATVSKGKFKLNFPTGNCPPAATKKRRTKKTALKTDDAEVPLATTPKIDFIKKAEEVQPDANQENLAQPPSKSPLEAASPQPRTKVYPTRSSQQATQLNPEPLDHHSPPASPYLGFQEDFELSFQLDGLQREEEQLKEKSILDGGGEKEASPSVPQLDTTYILKENTQDNTPSPKKDAFKDFYITSQQNQIQGEKTGLHNQWVQPVASSTPLQKPTRRALEADKDNQMVIDAGQKDIDAFQCPSCNMMYARGKPMDDKLHLKYHNFYTNTLKFKGWKKETVVREYPDGRVVVITSSDPKFMMRKVEEVHELIDKELGFQPINSAQAHQKSYLFITHTMEIAGLVTADTITKAYTLVNSAEDGCKVSRHGYYCSHESVPALCGILRLWTAPHYRRQKIATRILDCVSHSFIHGHYLQMDQLAFSDPTSDGHQFALAYCKSSSYLVHLAC